MLKGFKNFLLQGQLIIIAVGLVVALAFSALITSFTTNIITPLINAIAGKSNGGLGLGWKINNQFISVGAFISSIIYFIIFIAVVYFVIVVPYRQYMKKQGVTVYGTPAPPPVEKTCPQCFQADLPAAALKCWHCASDLSQPAPSPTPDPTD
ncbi:MAG: MscL family protein [Acidimicrobiales bacterium]